MACAALAVLTAVPASADERRPFRIMDELALGVGYSDGTGTAAAIRVSVLHPRLSVSIEALGLHGGPPRLPVDLGDATMHASVLAGVGVYRLAGAWDVLLLAVAGVHGFETEDRGFGVKGHKLPAAGLRASLYRSSGGQRAVFAALGISGEVLADLRREYDPVIERDVGGVTALLTLSLAYGLWF
jgi:hypothetical protein